jgi:hypothetical protein
MILVGQNFAQNFMQSEAFVFFFVFWLAISISQIAILKVKSTKKNAK